MANLNYNKYQEAILYFLNHCNNRHLGKKKLLKLLYYLDFDHYEKFGTSVTEDSYRKLQYGPVPVTVDPVMAQMSFRKVIRREVHHHTQGSKSYGQNRYWPTRDADLSVFLPSELGVLRSVAERCAEMTATAIEDATHKEAPWRLTKNIGDPIPYEYAILRRDDPSRMNKPNESAEVPLSVADREMIIQDLISTQRIEGIKLEYEEAAGIVDEVFDEPMPSMN